MERLLAQLTAGVKVFRCIGYWMNDDGNIFSDAVVNQLVAEGCVIRYDADGAEWLKAA